MTQVRTFALPQPLGERLAEPTPTSAPITSTISSATPRFLPDIPELTQRRDSVPKVNGDYKRVPMATYNDTKKEGGITFSGQDKLPKLPIPDLEATCRRYIESLRPLQSPREQAETQYAIDEFLKGDGHDLQEKLKQYAQGKTSYIEQFCMHNSHAPFLDLLSNIRQGMILTSISITPLFST